MLAVLGSPVGHSLSPRIHAAAMRHLGIDGIYEARDVDSDGMLIQAELMRRGALFGANITMPHKELAANLCDQLAPTAQRTGSVNTWVTSGRHIVGHSTDGDGVRFAWEAADLPGSGPVRILGAGGAAVAAAVELVPTHAVTISARRRGAATAVAARLGIGVAEWGSPCIGATVVNATPIGMAGETLDNGLTEGAVAYFEMVYAAGETVAESRFRNLGLPVASGIDMLVGQAAASFELWFGVSAPIGVMRGATK